MKAHDYLSFFWLFLYCNSYSQFFLSVPFNIHSFSYAVTAVSYQKRGVHGLKNFGNTVFGNGMSQIMKNVITMSITNYVSWTAFMNREHIMKPHISGQWCEVLCIVLISAFFLKKCLGVLSV
jgi:hypothetical protein